ncbi:MAG TPA: lysylphosphatidylglycerol synthase transmembrane domain-containing protein [Fimbriiglobus sp.]|nr:lysylphosphatidylglycerol synthase transmembrane domain-containing protein [Fimbriiglobus sp.]
MKKSGWWKDAAKYAIAVVLLTFVVSMNWTDLTNLLSQPPQVVPLLITVAGVLVVLAFQYYRWFLLVRALDLPFALRNAVRLGLVGTFYNTFLPGSIGGDFVKAFFIARGHPERKAAAVATVVADRLVGLFGLIAFGAVVGGAFWLAGDDKIAGNSKLQFIILGAAVLAGLGVVGYIALGFLPRHRYERFQDRLHGVRRFGPTLAVLPDDVPEFGQRPRSVMGAVATTAVAQTAMMLMFHYAVRIFPPADPALLGTLAEHFVILPIGYIVQAVIPLPGGLGVGELTFGGLYKMIRGEAGYAVGLAGRLALRLVEWCVGLIGYIAYLRMRDELPVAEAEAAAEEEDPYADQSAEAAKGPAA